LILKIVLTDGLLPAIADEFVKVNGVETVFLTRIVEEGNALQTM